MSNLHEGFKFGDPGFINIRGTNGSGKSTILKKYLPKGTPLKSFDDIGVQYYDCGTHFVVGRYETDCGGLDAVRGTYDKAQDTGVRGFEASQIAIARLAKQKTTFGEGVLFSTVFKGCKVIADSLEGLPYFWFSIDIPLDLVFASVLKRRVGTGNNEPLPTENISRKVRSVLSSLDKAVDAGMWTMYGSREVISANIDDLVNNRQLSNPELVSVKPDLETCKSEIQRWVDKEQVSPTPEMIKEYGPKQTTKGLSGFFKGANNATI